MMDIKRLKEIAGIASKDFNPRAVEDALVAIQDEAYSLQGSERDIILSAVEQISQVLSNLRGTGGM
jgi:hypothetical protein